MARKRVLVTGGSGYLGQFLVKSLAEDYEVGPCGRYVCLAAEQSFKPLLLRLVLFTRPSPTSADGT